MAAILVDELSASNLYLGVCGENNIEVITIDCSAWLTTYPNATFTVFAQLPRRSDVYPVSGVQVEDGVITWNVSSYDTSAAGNGMVEVRMYDDEKLKKSFMARTRIMPSLSGEETIPNEEAATWLSAIVANEKDRQSNFAKIAGMEVSVETLEPGSDATVTKTETETEYSLSFAIPRGDKGDKGDPGEVTQAELDAVTSQLADITNKQYARVYHNTIQSIADGTDTYLAFNSERVDTNAMHDVVTNNSRLTCKVAGTYLIIAQVVWSNASGVGQRSAGIRLNGTTMIANSSIPGVESQYVSMSCSTIYTLAVNDYVEVRVRQTSGGALSVIDSSTPMGTDFMMIKVV